MVALPIKLELSLAAPLPFASNAEIRTALKTLQTDVNKELMTLQTDVSADGQCGIWVSHLCFLWNLRDLACVFCT